MNITTKLKAAVIGAAVATTFGVAGAVATAAPAVLRPSTVGLCSSNVVGQHTSGTCNQVTHPGGSEGFYTWELCVIPGVGSTYLFGQTLHVAGTLSTTGNCGGQIGGHGINTVS